MSFGPLFISANDFVRRIRHHFIDIGGHDYGLHYLLWSRAARRKTSDAHNWKGLAINACFLARPRHFKRLQATPLHNAIKHEREIPFALKVELVTGTWQLERRRGTWSSKQRVETRERTLQRRTNTLRAALSGFTLSSFFLRQHTALGF